MKKSSKFFAVAVLALGIVGTAQATPHWRDMGVGSAPVTTPAANMVKIGVCTSGTPSAVPAYKGNYLGQGLLCARISNEDAAMMEFTYFRWMN